MAQKSRVLVVDDDPRILAAFERAVLSLGVEVDKASSRVEAFEKIRRRAYHVALVDIMLTNDVNDRGGIQVIKKINELEEGTLCIAISAHSTADAPVRAHEAGIYKYIIKKEIRIPEDYLKVVRKAAEECDLHLFGRMATLHAYLARPEQTPYWESALMQLLGVDAETLQKLTTRAFEPMLPVLRCTNQNSALFQHHKRNMISGMFWSRRLGRAIWISIAKKDCEKDAPPEGHSAQILYERTKGPENFSVWELPDTPRDDFHETTLQVE